MEDFQINVPMTAIANGMFPSHRLNISFRLAASWPHYIYQDEDDVFGTQDGISQRIEWLVECLDCHQAGTLIDIRMPNDLSLDADVSITHILVKLAEREKCHQIPQS